MAGQQPLDLPDMEKPLTLFSVEQIRSEIDAVDDAMLGLLQRRFAAIDAIKAAKQSENAKASSPMRPAREAEILRRLCRRGQGQVPVHLMVRLWRSIISAATSAQADVTVHIPDDIAENHEMRDMTRDYFAGLPLRRQPDSTRLIEEVAAPDIGVVRANSDWIAPLMKSQRLKVIGLLPVTGRREETPVLLILGQANAEPSGDDQTLVASKGGSDIAVAPLWETKARNYSCISLSGFLDEKSPDVLRLKERDAGAVIVGRCPCPLEVRA
jgi:chorismate mutase